MNVISPAERVGGKDPLSQRDPPRGRRRDDRRARSTTPTPSSARSTDHDVAAIILEPIPHNIGAVLPQPGFLERLRELATKHGTVLVFDEVITGFRHGLGGYQADRRRHARPDDARARRWRTAGRSPRSAARPS